MPADLFPSACCHHRPFDCVAAPSGRIAHATLICSCFLNFRSLIIVLSVPAKNADPCRFVAYSYSRLIPDRSSKHQHYELQHKGLDCCARFQFRHTDDLSEHPATLTCALRFCFPGLASNILSLASTPNPFRNVLLSRAASTKHSSCHSQTTKQTPSDINSSPCLCGKDLQHVEWEMIRLRPTKLGEPYDAVPQACRRAR